MFDSLNIYFEFFLTSKRRGYPLHVEFRDEFIRDYKEASFMLY